MAERLTIKNSDNTYSQPTDTTFEMVFNKLGKLEDILEKYGIESVGELDDFFANYKVSSFLTEDRIKKIAVNEQRKIMQSMVKEIVEKECNQLYTECDTWKRACELACKEAPMHCPDPPEYYNAQNEYGSDEPYFIQISACEFSDDVGRCLECQMDYFYQKAKGEK